jgi:putative redox protein
MEIEVSFPSGKRVDARVGDFTVMTDQPVELGGAGSAPAPFDLFLASLATCAGIYVLGYCQTRGIPTAGLRIVQRSEDDPATHRPRRVALEVHVPPGFPAAAQTAVARAAAACKVKKVLAEPPAFDVSVVAAAPPEEVSPAA